MIKVVSFKICPFVQRVTALLETKNVPYEIKFISLSNKPQWFLDISPTGQVPVLITENGIPLFESDAIAEYLDEVFEPLEPTITPEQRALDRAWGYQAAKHYLVQCSTQRSPDEQTLTERTIKLGKVFERVEAALGDGPYFKGERLSNVDIAWLPLLHRASIIDNYSCHDFLSDYPKVKKWQAELLKTNTLKKSVADDFEDTFTDFYLSDKTYLGAKRETCCAEQYSNASCKKYACC